MIDDCLHDKTLPIFVLAGYYWTFLWGVFVIQAEPSQCLFPVIKNCEDMEAIIFCGIQATGKSTFFKENFFKTHVRLSLDQLKTRNREQKFFELCIETRQSFVIDNTNPTKAEREKYVLKAKEKGFKIIGYYFQSKLSDALARNMNRKGKDNVAEIGIKGTFAKLEIPKLEEGFDELFYVEIINDNFVVKEWNNEI